MLQCVAREVIHLFKILFLVPDDSMIQYTIDTLSHQHGDITVATGFGYEAIPMAKRFLSDGGEVIIARAGTAVILRKALNITIVENSHYRI